jgi:hypothetical protein
VPTSLVRVVQECHRLRLLPEDFPADIISTQIDDLWRVPVIQEPGSFDWDDEHLPDNIMSDIDITLTNDDTTLDE